MEDRRSFLMKRAIEIAQVIVDEVEKINKIPIKDFNLSNWISFCEHNHRLTPKVKEILLFGSLAQGSQNPGDIDMVFLDTGWFSRGFLSVDGTKDKYMELSEQTFVLFSDWFRVAQEKYDLLKEIKIDLHILPFQVLYSEKVREKYLKGHSDQNFFTNAFSVLLRYDFAKKEFVLTSIEELVKKHQRKRVVKVN
ncbi:MAG: hypothetical protein Q8N55_01665 [bacterium]|nr:hypothetical protein [bacterium]